MTSRITILGSTGSIGQNTLDVIRKHPEKFSVYALTGNSKIDLLAQQCYEFKPKIAVVANLESAKILSEKLDGLNIEILHGQEGLVQASTNDHVDSVMAAIVGAAGLIPTIEAARFGKRILLANKEALVMSGDIFMAAVREGGAVLLPIDSEHNAIYQCLPAGADLTEQNWSQKAGVEELLLTASGGPFLNTPLHLLDDISPDQACAHPNWVMGRKISVDSATMMNKGLELIEAQWLFNLAPKQIDIVIHPQSVIHSLVRYVDGSVLAQLGQPDMRTPIAYGLGWPRRIEAGVKPLRLDELSELTFRKPDLTRFPCLKLAREAAEAGGTAPTILNAANEIAVDAFLNYRLPYLGIASVVSSVLNRLGSESVTSLEQILIRDKESRLLASEQIKELTR